MSNLLDRLGVGSLPRPVKIAVGAGACAGLMLSFALICHHWWEQKQSLQREILSLKLQQLERDVTAESDHLLETARGLASNDNLALLVEDSAAATAVTADSLDLGHRPVDAILVTNSAQILRYSASISQGQLIERGVDPAVTAFLNAVVAGKAGAATSSGVVGIAGNRLVAAWPIAARAAPGIELGWVVVSRSLSGRALKQSDLEAMPAAARAAVSAREAKGFGVTTYALDTQSGYAILHDEGGSPVWLMQLGAGGSAVAPAGGHFEEWGTWAAYGLAGVLSIALCIAAFYGLQRYFMKQRSVDSRYKAIIDQTNDGIVIVDATSHQVQYCNPAFLARLGYTDVEAESLTLPDIFADGTASTDSILARLRNADAKLALNMQQRCKDGGLIDIEVRCNTLDVDGREVLAYVTHDVSVRRKAEQQLIDNQQRLDKMAHHDQLTGLPNRHYLASFLPQAIAEAKAAGVMLGVVFLDLDRFKHINDTRGHEVGDKLLQEVALRLRACVRDSDVVIRMGGDEFVVVFRNVKAHEEVTLGAGRIIKCLEHARSSSTSTRCKPRAASA